jgi:hypothetical protein
MSVSPAREQGRQKARARITASAVKIANGGVNGFMDIVLSRRLAYVTSGQ